MWFFFFFTLETNQNFPCCIFFVHHLSSCNCASPRKAWPSLLYALLLGSSQQHHCNQLFIKFARINIVFQKHLVVYTITYTNHISLKLTICGALIVAWKPVKQENGRICWSSFRRQPYNLYHLDCKMQYLNWRPHSGRYTQPPPPNSYIGTLLQMWIKVPHLKAIPCQLWTEEKEKKGFYPWPQLQSPFCH